ncbi:MAG TPA: tetratricopeptide repeat protein [Steroidobacteraceae bacterium]|nr:tetratricopeptide repeat protein [Steroidobacteraceae bacterium]
MTHSTCWSILIVALAAQASADTPPAPQVGGSMTVVGANELLSAGADELQRGNYEQGVALTLQGLDRPNSREDRAAGLANLCAGYVGLRKYELALAKCSESLELNGANWRTWNNRAAAYLGKGMLEAALSDVQAGLQLSPQSGTLKKTKQIVLERKRVHEEQRRKAVGA